METEDTQPSKQEVMTLIVNSYSINPLVAVLKDLESFYDYGTLRETVNDVHELLNFWYAEDKEKENTGNPHHVVNRLHQITRLISFLTAIHENFTKLKEDNAELKALLNKDAP